MVKKLFSLLQNAGVPVYLPAKKEGKCTEAYAVVGHKKSEPAKTGKSAYAYFTVSLIAPVENFAAMEELEQRCVNALKGSNFKYVESDEDNAYTESLGYKRILTYRIIKRNCNN